MVCLCSQERIMVCFLSRDKFHQSQVSDMHIKKPPMWTTHKSQMDMDVLLPITSFVLRHQRSTLPTPGLSENPGKKAGAIPCNRRQGHLVFTEACQGQSEFFQIWYKLPRAAVTGIKPSEPEAINSAVAMDARNLVMGTVSSRYLQSSQNNRSDMMTV